MYCWLTFFCSEGKFCGNIQIFKLGTNLNFDTDVVPKFKILNFFLLPSILCTPGEGCIMLFMQCMDASLSQKKKNKMTQKHILIRLHEVLVS